MRQTQVPLGTREIQDPEERQDGRVELGLQVPRELLQVSQVQLDPQGQIQPLQDQPVTLEAQDPKGARELQDPSVNKATLGLLELGVSKEFKDQLVYDWRARKVP